MTNERRTSGAQAGPADWLVGGGELAELIRVTDWSGTPLGPRERWPESLRFAVNLVVASRVPMCVLWGPELRLLYNDGYREIAADRHPSALGRPVSEVWPEIWPEIEPLLAAVMERGESFVFENRPFRLRRRDASEDTYFTLSYSPVRAEDGTVRGVLNLLQETTAAVESRRLLSESETRLRSLIDLAPYGAHMYELDHADRLVFIGYNKSAERILGVDHAQFLGKLITEAFPAALPETPVRYAEVAKTGKPWEVEHFTYEHGAISGVFEVRAVQTASRRMVAFFRDVTERKRAEDRLRSEQELMAKVLDTQPDTFFLFDGVSGKALRWNRAFREVSGYSDDEIAMLPAPASYYGGDDLKRAQVAMEGILQGREESIVLDLVRKDGRRVPTEYRAAALRDERGVPRLVIAIGRDITERRRAEAELRAVNEKLVEIDRRRAEFLAMLSHELRNPLAPIRTSIYILERAAPGGEQARRAQAVIERQAGHMARLVDELLDVTRIERGKIELQREKLDLNDLVRHTVEDHRGECLANGLKLTTAFAAGEVWINGDRTRLAQAVGNLLQNAAKFTPRGGSIAVSVEQDVSRVEAILVVRDTGAGIAPQMMPRLFEAFSQADRTLDRGKGGLGLGLAVVKGLVEMHGGSVSAVSQGVGKGAEFTIRLPLETNRPASREEQVGSHRAGVPLRVLVIEDNVDAADSLREALELIGHVVVVAHDGPAGIAQARILRPEVVLCDIGLPGMDGYAVARALRADPEFGRVRLVALTGYAGPEDVAKAQEAGFDAHLAKPPSMDALEKALATLGVHGKEESGVSLPWLC